MSNDKLLKLAVGFSFIIAIYMIKTRSTMGIHIEPMYLVFLLGIMALRSVIDQYNYQEIETDHIKANMILSASTVLMFSFVKGIPDIPQIASEDRRARLTHKQVEAIQIWRKTKLGRETVTIVRKIPFAIFIAIGTIIYLSMEVISKWYI